MKNFETSTNSREMQPSALDRESSVKYVEGVLAGIDEQLLKEIFGRHLERSHCIERLTQHISAQDIGIVYEPNSRHLGRFKPGNQDRVSAIEINAAISYKDEAEQLYSELKTFSPEHTVLELSKEEVIREFERIFLMQIRIHEGLHAISETGCIGTSKFSDESGTEYDMTHNQVGFSIKSSMTTEHDGEVFFGHWMNLNEGATDLFANMVLKEYLEQSGDVRGNIVDAYFTLPELTRISAYSEYVFVCRVYISFIAAVTGTDEESVHRAFMRDYLRGEIFMPDEFLETFNEIVQDSLKAEKMVNSSVDLDQPIDFINYLIEATGKLPLDQIVRFCKMYAQHTKALAGKSD